MKSYNLVKYTMLQAIPKCSKLRHLSFTNAVNLTEEIFYKIFTLLPDLIRLKLHEATQIKATIFMKVFTCDQTCVNNLQILKLTSCYTLNDEIVNFILKKYMHTLRVLSLMSCKNVTFNVNTEILKKCKKIINLNLAFTKIQPEHFQTIVGVLTNLKTIVTDPISITNQFVWQDIRNKNPFLQIMIQESEYSNRQYIVYKL